ncbi:MAG TPA: ATP-dependent zinc metalloprotease FtsH [Thermomicrobiaceae bacterium]|nr:ATP-dependent zinc metalloprotease FtsH [Thermomicrobiaceae bacterium]
MRDPKQGPGDQRKSKPGYERWQIGGWILVIGVAVAALLILPGLWFGSSPVAHVSYSQTLTQIDQGNVRSVTIKGDQLTGTLVQPIATDSAQSAQPGVKTNGLDGSGASSSRFSTTIPSGAATDLLATLQAHNVDISAESSGGGGFALGSLLLWIGLPVLMVLGMMVFLRRGGSTPSTQNRLFSFGRSTARVYDADRPLVTFADVAGEDEAKGELVQVVDFLRNPGKYHQLGAQLPRGVLMVGPPGTGKTLLAKAVAGEAGVPFFSASASEFVEMFVGVGASRVRDLFEKAKTASPAIIFVDEIDAVGRKRGVGLGGGNDEREQTLNQLLVELDGFDTTTSVIVIAATNRPDVLDPALLRPGRFDRQVTVGLPDQRGREAIIRVHLRGHPVGPTVDPALVASSTPGFAGADLANLVNEAALVAAAHDKHQIEEIDFSEALDKIILGAERPLLMTEEEKRVIAYHESGHAVVAYLTPGCDPLRKVSIVPRGRSLGVTVQSPVRDRFNFTRRDLKGRLVVMFGGRAAERLVFEEITTGAENDLKQATHLARRMVERWGMSDDLGDLVLDRDDDMYGDFAGFGGRDAGVSTQELADESVRRLLEEARLTAEQLLERNHETLDRLARALMEEETLGSLRLMEILGAAATPGQPVAQAAD